MCGITGIYNFSKNRNVDGQLLKRMTDVISHRGPDGEGFYINKNIGLGHRRLSIIDLNTGNQPMFNEDKSLTLVHNGEIYNYLELKEELIKLGYYFRTLSDTEVILRAYQEWGVECQNKFNGMWAFALWDEKKQQLFISRDRIGEKPLNYAVHENTLVFASEIKALFEYGIPREIRHELIEVYLTLSNIPGPDTFYKNIFKLKPGHFIIANPDGIKEFKYWDLPEIDEGNMINNKVAIYDEFAYLFEDSIKIRMRSDVPFGAFLSGGLDSSCIVALMSKISSFPVETFTIGFQQKEFDESKLAKMVADKFKTNHHFGTVGFAEINDLIKKNILHFDEPFGDSSSMPTYQVSKFAAQKVKMVLTGDGGDEVLCGYTSYRGVKFSNLYSQIPSFFTNGLPQGVDFLSKKFHGKTRYKLNRVTNVLETANYNFTKRFAYKTANAPISLIKKLSSNINNVISIEDYIIDMDKKNPYRDDFYRLMYLHLKHSLPDDYLVKVDRMSMANSIETRAPFLDHRLIEFMCKVDKNIKMQGWEQKSILRNTIAKQLPNQLINAQKKGFVPPVREWFKTYFDSDLESLRNIKLICGEENLNQIIINNRNGSEDYGNFLWTLILLDKFV